MWTSDQVSVERPASSYDCYLNAFFFPPTAPLVTFQQVNFFRSLSLSTAAASQPSATAAKALMQAFSLRPSVPPSSTPSFTPSIPAFVLPSLRDLKYARREREGERERSSRQSNANTAFL